MRVWLGLSVDGYGGLWGSEEAAESGECELSVTRGGDEVRSTSGGPTMTTGEVSVGGSGGTAGASVGG